MGLTRALLLSAMVWCAFASFPIGFATAAPSPLSRFSPLPYQPSPDTLTIFLAGDVMLGRGITTFLQKGHTNLQFWSETSRRADVAFCNLECAVADGLSLGDRAGIGDRSGITSRSGVRLIAPRPSLHYLQQAGFDVVSVANNHALDGGERGLNCLDVAMSRLRIGTVGINNPVSPSETAPETASVGRAEKDDTISTPFTELKSRPDSKLDPSQKPTNSHFSPWQAWQCIMKGHHIVWLAATAWGPFQSGRARVRPLAHSGLLQQTRQLVKAGYIVFVSLHWGNEYQARPTAGQRLLAHALIEAGASCIVGHHPHVAGPVEVYQGHPIFYSLGNYVFDRTPRPQSGMVALVSIQGHSISFRTFPIDPTGSVPTGLALKGLAPTQFVPTEFVPTGLISLPSLSPSSLPSLPRPEKLIQRERGQFLRGKAERQWLYWSRLPSGVNCLRVLHWSEGAWRVMAQGFHPQIEKLFIADVDGDGADEVWLQLRQRSKLDVRVRARLFLYSVDPQRGFRPRWRGSALSRPFREWTPWKTEGKGDRTAAQSDHNAVRDHNAAQGHGKVGYDLAALETDALAGDGDFSWVSIYRWNGFGFRRVWDTPLRGTLRHLQAGSDQRGPTLRLEQLMRSRSPEPDETQSGLQQKPLRFIYRGILVRPGPPQKYEPPLHAPQAAEQFAAAQRPESVGTARLGDKTPTSENEFSDEEVELFHVVVENNSVTKPPPNKATLERRAVRKSNAR